MIYFKGLSVFKAVVAALVCSGCVLAGIAVDKTSGNLAFSEVLATVSSGTLSYPVVLGATSNIKINQRASWVGLGFSLDAPAVERIAVGSADELSAINPIFESQEVGGDAGEYVGTGYSGCEPYVMDFYQGGAVWDRLLMKDGNHYGGCRRAWVPEKTDAAEGYITTCNNEFSGNFSSISGKTVVVQTDGSIVLKCRITKA